MENLTYEEERIMQGMRQKKPVALNVRIIARYANLEVREVHKALMTLVQKKKLKRWYALWDNEYVYAPSNWTGKDLQDAGLGPHIRGWD